MKKSNSIKVLMLICIMIGFYVNNPNTLLTSNSKMLISFILLGVSGLAFFFLIRNMKDREKAKKQGIILIAALIISGLILYFSLK
jgi:amino acid transporter